MNTKHITADEANDAYWDERLAAETAGDLPEIISREDVGDEDRRIWIVTAELKGETAQATHGDRFTAEGLATDAVRARVAAARGASKWIVQGQMQKYGPFNTEAETEHVRMYQTNGWGEVKQVYPCPQAPRTPDTDHDFVEAE
jgi:hypothetical protein